jgi:uncharacterized protein YgiM (DUF1202 family)
MKKMFSGFAQLVLGFAIAILLVVGGSVAASLYLVARLTALPPKPDFSAHSSETAIATPTPSPSPTSSPKPKPTNTPKPTPTPTPTPGLYQAKVVWPDGLVIRAEPSYEAASVGGVAFDVEVTVLEEKDAGAWQRIRSGSGEEGWVVGGNLATIDAVEPSTTTETP